MTARTLTVPAGTSKEDWETLFAASKNVEGTREQMRSLLIRDPGWIERIGTLAATAEEAIFGTIKGTFLVEEAWRADASFIRASLAMPGDGALERLLAERVVLSWLALALAEIKRADRWQGGGSAEEAVFWDRHVSRLSTDFLHASKALATVRRLRVPSVQINFGEQQVNQVRL